MALYHLTWKFISLLRRKSVVSAEFQLSMLKASLDFDPHIVGSQVVLEEEEEQQLIEDSRKHSRRSLGELSSILVGSCKFSYLHHRYATLDGVLPPSYIPPINNAACS
jgi:hypothetical protein